jgi:hypothetical protein
VGLEGRAAVVVRRGAVGPLGRTCARACAEEGLRILDPKLPLIAESRRAYEGSGQALYWYDDTHMSAAGNTFAASVIYRELLR